MVPAKTSLGSDGASSEETTQGILHDASDDSLAAKLEASNHENEVLKRQLDGAVAEVFRTRATLAILEKAAHEKFEAGNAPQHVRKGRTGALDSPFGNSSSDKWSSFGDHLHADAAALADTLLTSELALEAALIERDDLAKALSNAEQEVRHRQADARNLKELQQRHLTDMRESFEMEYKDAQRANFMRVSTLEDALKKALTDKQELDGELVRHAHSEQAIAAKSACGWQEMQARLIALEKKYCLEKKAAATLQTRNADLMFELREQDAAWGVFAREHEANHVQWAAFSRDEEDEVSTLKKRLAAAWEMNELQTSEFVASLHEVQEQVLHVQRGRAIGTSSAALPQATALRIGPGRRCVDHVG